MHFDQAGYDLKCEWGLEGLRALQANCDAVVIVDVLSFSTSVDIALSRGAAVLPFRWKDHSAERFAAEKGALLAGGNRTGGSREGGGTRSHRLPFARSRQGLSWSCPRPTGAPWR
ncbi:MAG: hypothetical protein ABUS51_00590 [Acidobacteriota bacterium]